MDSTEPGNAASEQADASKPPIPINYVYVRDAETLRFCTESIARSRSVAVDTEADSLHNYFEKVCLIQLSFSGENYIVDPLAGQDLREFASLLATKPLVLHGADYDLRLLRAAFGFQPQQDVFDTMIAAQLLGIEQIGLAALIEKFFSVTLAKQAQKSDWSHRPLTDSQLRYAIGDTRFLTELAERLGRELRDRGRMEWLEESCRAMVESTAHDRVRDPDDLWRIKGAGHLTSHQLAFLRELWHWRDRHARARNRPAFKIFGNQQMMELVQWLDSHPGVPLEQGPKLPRNIKGELLRSLGQAVAQAVALSPDQWPDRKKGQHIEQPSADVIARTSALRAACAELAKELGIAAQVLAPRAALEAIAQTRPQTIDEIMKAGGLLRWQAELVHSAMAETLTRMKESAALERVNTTLI